MTSGKRKILKELLNNKHEFESKVDLKKEMAVSSYMKAQWEIVSDCEIKNDKIIERRLWNNIQNRINKRKNKHALSYYRTYSVAASFLLLAVLGFSFYFMTHFEKKVETYMYVVSTGVCNMKSVMLPDGTVVHMGPKSTLTYPEQFDGKKRIVKLEGQGYFDVAKNREKPFVVKTGNMDVTALGTAFEIFNYDENEYAETILASGRVSVELFGENVSDKKEIQLIPNEKLIISRTDYTAKIEHVNAAKYTAWHHNSLLSFEGETLKNILPRLEKWYGREIICNGNLEKYQFTFKVRDESLGTILYLMSQSSPLSYQKNGEAYVLKLK